jgi:hypothetical protein
VNEDEILNGKEGEQYETENDDHRCRRAAICDSRIRSAREDGLRSQD